MNDNDPKGNIVKEALDYTIEQELQISGGIGKIPPLTLHGKESMDPRLTNKPHVTRKCKGISFLSIVYGKKIDKDVLVFPFPVPPVIDGRMHTFLSHAHQIGSNELPPLKESLKVRLLEREGLIISTKLLKLVGLVRVVPGKNIMLCKSI